MKITKQKLKQIIKEELISILKEDFRDYARPSPYKESEAIELGFVKQPGPGDRGIRGMSITADPGWEVYKKWVDAGRDEEELPKPNVGRDLTGGGRDEQAKQMARAT